MGIRVVLTKELTLFFLVFRISIVLFMFSLHIWYYWIESSILDKYRSHCHIYKSYENYTVNEWIYPVPPYPYGQKGKKKTSRPMKWAAEFTRKVFFESQKNYIWRPILKLPIDTNKLIRYWITHVKWKHYQSENIYYLSWW